MKQQIINEGKTVIVARVEIYLFCECGNKVYEENNFCSMCGGELIK